MDNYETILSHEAVFRGKNISDSDDSKINLKNLKYFISVLVEPVKKCTGTLKRYLELKEK